MKDMKGQVWTTDFLIGLVLFLVVVIIVVKIIFQIYPSQRHVDAYRDAIHISDALLSPGYPDNWNVSTVLMPGISRNNRIDETKLSEFASLDYYRTKILIHTDSDYLFFIKDNSGKIFLIDGKCSLGYAIAHDVDCVPAIDSLSYENLMKVDRLIIYNSTVMTLTVYAWN